VEKKAATAEVSVSRPDCKIESKSKSKSKKSQKNKKNKAVQASHQNGDSTISKRPTAYSLKHSQKHKQHRQWKRRGL
jgi:hypothetical protein